eukprot:2046745-Amphidinium_carterae.1
MTRSSGVEADDTTIRLYCALKQDPDTKRVRRERKSSETMVPCPLKGVVVLQHLLFGVERTSFQTQA